MADHSLRQDFCGHLTSDFSRRTVGAMEYTEKMRLALAARCSVRTVERYLDGGTTRPAITHAIEEAARRLKLDLPAKVAL